MFLFVTDLFFFQIFRLCRCRPDLFLIQIFCFLTDLFIRLDIFLFIRQAHRLCTTVATSRQLPPLFAQLTYT
jgi:hypothetical protein